MSKCCFRFGVLVLGLNVSLLHLPRLVAGASASVHIVGVDAYGNAFATVSVVSFVDRQGKDWVGQFKGGLAQDIPLGRYHLEVYHAGLLCEMNAEVSSQDSWITAGFESPVIEEGSRLLTPMSGRVNGLAGGDGTRCRLEGVYLQLRYESALRSDGHFDFGLVAPGAFVLSCFKSGQILILRSVRVEGGQLPLVFENDRSDRR